MAKMWQGRFKKELDEGVNDFNSSIAFDCRLYVYDVRASMAHAAMLGKQGIISPEDCESICEGLAGILKDLDDGKLAFDPAAEDVHMFVEAELTARIGEAGKRLHTARSRNDQVAVDMKMYVRDEIAAVVKLLKQLIAALVKTAEDNLETIMPGYTHMQRAQPITFAHHLMAYVEMFKRDMTRFYNAFELLNVMPLGSCALAGTTYPLDREFTADKLGFDSVTLNSLDGVSDRDYCIETLSDIALTMTHLSRLSEEIVLWCGWEFRFVELDDAFATGSSIMPQKKNPDVTELVRGKCGRCYGHLSALLTVMKGLPLAYNKDMQEDKEAVFDAFDTVKICLSTITPMLASMKVLKKNMLTAAKKGFINATDCADYLVGKGVAFRDAYKISGELVALCIDEDTTLDELPLDKYRDVCDKFQDDIYAAIDLLTCVKNRKVAGGPAPETVAEHIRLIKESVLAD